MNDQCLGPHSRLYALRQTNTFTYIVNIYLSSKMSHYAALTAMSKASTVICQPRLSYLGDVQIDSSRPHL